MYSIIPNPTHLEKVESKMFLKRAYNSCKYWFYNMAKRILYKSELYTVYKYLEK